MVKTRDAEKARCRKPCWARAMSSLCHVANQCIAAGRNTFRSVPVKASSDGKRNSGGVRRICVNQTSAD